MENNNDEQERTQWSLILMFLLNFDNHLYSSFADSVTFENRFIPSNSTVEFLDKLKSFSKQATGYISKDKILYRARLIDEGYMTNFIKEFFEAISDGNFKEDLKISDMSTMIGQSLFESIMPVLLSKPEIKSKFVSFIHDYQNRTFQGFDAAGSGATPANRAPEGRLNPRLISYLYTAEDADTAIYEIKPIILQGISLATIKPIKRLKVLDLCKKFQPDTFKQDESVWYYPSLMQIVSEKFSIPNHGDILAYLPTQYIAEYVKTILGFDGIRFKSSLKNGGKNVVIFDEKLCEVTSSKVHYIDKIKINYHSLNQDIQSIQCENNE